MFKESLKELFRQTGEGTSREKHEEEEKGASVVG